MEFPRWDSWGLREASHPLSTSCTSDLSLGFHTLSVEQEFILGTGMQPFPVLGDTDDPGVPRNWEPPRPDFGRVGVVSWPQV